MTHQNEQLKTTLLEIVRKTSCEMPKDVLAAIDAATEREKIGTSSRYAMDIVCENIKIAKNKSQPVCQDTGSILFFVKAPIGYDQIAFEEAAKAAVAEATAKGYLRQNSVDSLTGKNSGNNLGPGFPHFHFEYRHAGDPSCPNSDQLQFTNHESQISVSLILKGGGCENCGIQYSLPNKNLGAERDLDGVKKCILDAVIQAQGKGCGPGILGVCIGGDRATSYLHSKEQLLRKLTDENTNPSLAKMETEVMEIGNKTGIGPMGFGGATTLLGCKIGHLNRLPASFFVSISYMCWADRRQGALITSDAKIKEWLY